MLNIVFKPEGPKDNLKWKLGRRLYVVNTKRPHAPQNSDKNSGMVWASDPCPARRPDFGKSRGGRPRLSLMSKRFATTTAG
jgi:hypothetical protein